MSESLRQLLASESTVRTQQRHANVEQRIRQLCGVVPHVPGYADEMIRVLQLNRERPRGHPGRIFLARDLKTRREIQQMRASDVSPS